jgi:hypothetical protein
MRQSQDSNTGKQIWLQFISSWRMRSPAEVRGRCLQPIDTIFVDSPRNASRFSVELVVVLHQQPSRSAQRLEPRVGVRGSMGGRFAELC